MRNAYIMGFFVASIFLLGYFLAYSSPKLVEGIYCPNYQKGGLLTEGDIKMAMQKKSHTDMSDGLGLSLNLKIRRAEPTGRALLLKQPITELY